MAGLFGVLGVANRGLVVAQQGIRTAGHNVANVNTPGFSRQRQVNVASDPFVSPNGHLGTGAEQLTIERVTDRFLQAQLIKQGSLSSATDAQSKALSLTEQVLNEQDGAGPGSAISRFYAAFSDLASAQVPGAATEREAVRSAAGALVATLQNSDAQLRDFQRSTDDAITNVVSEINALTGRIRQLNLEIQQQEVQAPANDLRDQRELALRDLAAKIDVQTFEDESGLLYVQLPGGLPLVEGVQQPRLDIAGDPGNPFDPSFVRIVFDDGATRSDVTDEVGGGELGGLLRVRDTLLPAAIRSLDTVAYNLAVTVNAVHAAGVGLDGSTGDFFAAPLAVEDAARDLALDANIAGNPQAIAAGLSTAPGDNRNALALAELESSSGPLFLPGDPPGPASGPNRSVLEHLATVVADIGQQARSLEQSSDQQRRILDGLENRRDETSGVSLDEELTNLIQLQAAFQANTRILSTVDRLLQDLVNIL